jgi:hypothetical protein
MPLGDGGVERETWERDEREIRRGSEKERDARERKRRHTQIGRWRGMGGGTD